MAAMLTDAEIVEALQGADQVAQSRAVDHLLKDIKPSIIHYVRANSGTREEGLTMASEAVVELWKAIHALKFDLRADTKLATWCNSVARRRWLKELRRRKGGDNASGVSGNEPMDLLTPEDQYMENEIDPIALAEQQKAMRAFDRLGADCQQLFRMDADKKKPEEIMLAMGWKDQDYVRLKRFRCRKAFNQFHEAERSSRGPLLQPARP